MKEDDLTKDSVIIKEFMSESKPVERIKVLDYICALQNENNDLKMKLPGFDEAVGCHVCHL